MIFTLYKVAAIMVPEESRYRRQAEIGYIFNSHLKEPSSDTELWTDGMMLRNAV